LDRFINALNNESETIELPSPLTLTQYKTLYVTTMETCRSSLD